MSFEELRDSVLLLSEEQRFEIVELLLETLPDDAPPENLLAEEPGFYQELDRRMADTQGWKSWEEIKNAE